MTSTMGGAGEFLPPVVARLFADISQYQAKMADARGEMHVLTSEGSAGYTKYAQVGKAALLGLAGVAAVVAIAGIKAAMDEQTARARLTTAMKDAKISYDANASAVEHLDTKMVALDYTHSQTEASLAKLVSVTKNMKTATADVALAADIARGRHMDLMAATDLLAKVETGHVSLLGRMGINTKDATGATISQQEAVRRLSEMYGGQASAYTHTFAGEIEHLKVTAEEFSAKIGAVLIPVVDHMGSALASVFGFFAEHKTTTLVLAGVIATVLVPAMLLWLATETKLMAVKLVNALLPLVGVAGQAYASIILLAQGESVATVATATLGGAMTVAIPAVAAFAGAFVATTAVLHHFFHGTDWQAEANKTSRAVQTLANTPTVGMVSAWYKLTNEMGKTPTALNASLKPLLLFHDLAETNRSAAERLAAEVDHNSLTYRQMSVVLADVAVQQARKAGLDIEGQNIAAQTTKLYGVDVPDAYLKSASAAKSFGKIVQQSVADLGVANTQTLVNLGFTGDALKGLDKDAETFAKDLAASVASSTDAISHFKNATEVSGHDFLQFTVETTDTAVAWMGDLQHLMSEGVSKSIVAELAKMGPASAPSVKALQQVVDSGMIGMLNAQESRLQEMEAQTDSAFATMAVSIAEESARASLLHDAAVDEMAGHGTAKYEELTRSADTQLRAQAQTALTQLGLVQTTIDGLHGKSITVTADIGAAMTALDQLNQRLGDVNVNLSHTRWDIPGNGPPPAAHGAVALARGGSAAGMIVPAGHPVIIGDGLSSGEAVLPFDNFADSVTTIRNTGKADKIAAAAHAAMGHHIAKHGGDHHEGGSLGGGAHAIIVPVTIQGNVLTQIDFENAVAEALRKVQRQGGDLSIRSSTRYTG